MSKSRNKSVQSKENHSTAGESRGCNRKSKSNSFTQPQRNSPFVRGQRKKERPTKKDTIDSDKSKEAQGDVMKKLSLTPQVHKKEDEISIEESSSIIIKESKEEFRSRRIVGRGPQKDGCIRMWFSNNDIRSAFITKLIQCELWHPFHQRPYYNSLIIFDWDDTLFPTTNLLNRKDFNEDLSGNERLTKKIKNLQINVLSILTSSINRGQTFIITNAVPGWVESNTKRFFPSVVPLLSQIKVISAREEFERYYPCNPRMWKIKSFLNILQYFDCHRITNIVCIGDSEYEMDAGKKMASYFKHACIKRVRFKLNPSFHEVTNQIYSVINQFGFIHSSAKSGVYHANIKEKVKKTHSRKSSKKSFH